MKYEIGQSVWLATFETREAWEVCPDCAGTGRIRFLYPDDTVAAIPCEGCSRGYDAPNGRVRYYAARPKAEFCTITGVEINGSKTEWRTSSSYRVEEDRLFDTEETAQAKANEIAADYEAEQKGRALGKEKPTKSWSWHVHYHRRAIRDAQKQIAYHSAKLTAAKIKAKDSDNA